MTARIATENAPYRSSVELSGSEIERDALGEDAFKRMIAIERKRTERSREPFLLMLLEAGPQNGSTKQAKTLDGIITALHSCTRDTDVIGWYKNGTTVGAVFTGLIVDDRSTVLTTILARVSAALQSELTFDQLNQISFSFHFFPDEWDSDGSGDSSNPVLYPDLVASSNSKRAMFGVKRLVDILGSAMILAAGLPVFLGIALAIKATSRGPVFFRQDRVGQYGRRFTFLKFRSMEVNNDNTVHREYVKKLIAGNAERIALEGNSEGVYKLANDRRITPVGKLLRRSSLDELPQFLNVLLGDMSLVGPRPPIPYELAAYQTWHRRRLLQVKPGITGLWQVTGRSRVTFDDMVRLDLQYAESWSPWLDLKILFRTPAAVIKGAY
ncbi:MAG TPA: sugar transferase [Acidobacteriaceae bacterium]|nr:sugar transferase [Acidobacteriaceae bacterium]